MRGEYDFYTLVVALLVLLLQIHNPFQPKCVCACGGGSGAAASAEAASPLGRPLEQSSSRAARHRVGGSLAGRHGLPRFGVF